MRDIIRICIAGFVLLLIILFLGALLSYLAVGGVQYHPSYEKAEKLCERDYKELQTVVDYATTNGYDTFFVNSTENTAEFFAGPEAGQVHIQDESVIQSLDYLMKVHDYSVINYANNTIYFQKWAMHKRAAGIAYVLDGNCPDIQYMTYYKALSVENWYYFEINYYE